MSTGSRTDAIEDISEFLDYTDKMTRHLALLGTVLGIDDFATATVDGSGCLQTKCLAILRHWLDVTPNPTWKLFCEKLGKNNTFNNLRARIAQDHGVSGSKPDVGDSQPDGAVQVKKPASTIPGLVPSNPSPDGPIGTPPTSTTEVEANKTQPLPPPVEHTKDKEITMDPPSSPPTLDLTPSDVGLQGILSIVPSWSKLAISLGVPELAVKTNMLIPLGGMKCLSYWKKGESGEGFPNTWRFLLKTVEDTFGPHLAETIEKKVYSETSWSILKKPSGDIVKWILGPKGLFEYLEENLSVDNHLASKLYGSNLLGDPPLSEIRAMNNNGKHQEAFLHWYLFASKYYTEKSFNDLCECLRRAGDNARSKLTEVATKIEMAIRRVNSSEGGRHFNLNPHHRYPGPCSPGPCSPGPRTPGPVIPEPGSPGYGPYDVPKNRQPGDQSIEKKTFVRMLSKNSQVLSEDESLMSLPIVEQVDKCFKSLVGAVQGHVCNCEDFFALHHHCRQYLEQLLSGHIPSDPPMLPEAKQQLLDGIMKYWNALSYGLLEAIIKHLQSKRLDKRLDDYKEIVAQSATTTLEECEWKQVKMFRAQYLKVTYSEDPNKFELSRILEFQEFLEKRCGINQSLFMGAEKSSVILFFLIPREAADRLHSEVDYSVLRSLKVCCIEFEGEWQRTILTPTEESKCQDKVHECVGTAILSLVYDRLKDDQCNVCYDESEWKSFKESLLVTYTSLNILKSKSNNTVEQDPKSPQGDKILKCQLKMKKTQRFSISTNVNSSTLKAIGTVIGKSSGAGAGEQSIHPL